MQEVDALVQGDPGIQQAILEAAATLEAARVQADAAIRAAEIAAQATRDAGMLQVWIGFASVLAAFVAAAVAYRAGRLAYRAGVQAAQAAIQAAHTQTELENSKHAARIDAYTIKQKAIVKKIKNELINDIIRARSSMMKFEESPRNKLGLIIFNRKEPKDWGPDDWENQALLGSSFVSLLLVIRSSYEGVIKICEFIKGVSRKAKYQQNMYYFYNEEDEELEKKLETMDENEKENEINEHINMKKLILENYLSSLNLAKVHIDVLDEFLDRFHKDDTQKLSIFE